MKTVLFKYILKKHLFLFPFLRRGGSFGLDLNCHVRMRLFKLCESPPGADRMTTKLWQAHMSTHAHWGALIPKTTLARMYISIKHWSEYLHKYIDSVFFAAALHLCCHSAYCPSTLALQACMAWLNICSQVQQEHPLSVWHSLPTEMQAPGTRLVAQAGCHKWGSRQAKRGGFFFPFG